MNQTRAVVAGVAAVGALLYLRSRRIAGAARGAGSISVPTDDLGANVSGGSGMPTYRGLGAAWTRTTNDGAAGTMAAASGAEDAAGDSGDAAGVGATIFARTGVSVGTDAGDTAASFTLGGGGGGRGSAAPAYTGNTGYGGTPTEKLIRQGGGSPIQSTGKPSHGPAGPKG